MLRAMDILNITAMAMGRAVLRAAMAIKTGKRKTPNGIIVYNGPSALDPDVNIVVIITGIETATSNGKTGDMLQVWILREDMEPNVASATGQDVAICGDCPHRRSQGGSCYVDPGKAALAIWRAYKKENYPQVPPREAGALLAGMWVRFGAYGDPSAVPIEVWDPIALTAKKRSGYTRQWHNLDVKRWGFLMASTMTEDETTEAEALGWRTFRIRSEGAEVMDGEIDCPAAKDDSPMPITCAACNLCEGRNFEKKRIAKSVTVVVHGWPSFVGRFDKQQAVLAIAAK